MSEAKQLAYSKHETILKTHCFFIENCDMCHCGMHTTTGQTFECQQLGIERGKRFRKFRLSKQLTLREAAKQWGLSAVVLSLYEQGAVATDWTPPGFEE